MLADWDSCAYSACGGNEGSLLNSVILKRTLLF
jgi:hypothetical protein